MSIDKICTSCCEKQPRHECPESDRTCGHHCNCSWHQDRCCWCNKDFGPDSSSEPLDIYCLTPKQIIRELLVRLYILHPDPALLRARGSLNDPLTWPRGMDEPIPEDWLNVALGGEAKVLWDMYNEKPVEKDL